MDEDYMKPIWENIDRIRNKLISYGQIILTITIANIAIVLLNGSDIMKYIINGVGLIVLIPMYLSYSKWKKKQKDKK